MALVDQRHGVESSQSREVVAAIVLVAVLRSNSQEVADRRVMRDLLTVDLCAIRILSLQSLANDRIEWFQKHSDVVESSYRVRYDIFEPLERIFGFTGFFHEVGVHAAGHRGVLEGCFGHHGLDGEGYSCKVEVSAYNLLSYNFYHFLSD